MGEKSRNGRLKREIGNERRGSRKRERRRERRRERIRCADRVRPRGRNCTKWGKVETKCDKITRIFTEYYIEWGEIPQNERNEREKRDEYAAGWGERSVAAFRRARKGRVGGFAVG